MHKKIKTPLLGALTAIAAAATVVPMAHAQSGLAMRQGASAPAAPARGTVREVYQRNGLTLRILESECADGQSPVALIAESRDALPENAKVTNTIANGQSRMSLECRRALGSVVEVPLVSPQGAPVDKGFLYVNFGSRSVVFDRQRLSARMERWLRNDTTVSLQYVYILSGYFEDAPSMITGSSQMAQIIYAFSEADARYCPEVVGTTSEVTWSRYMRWGPWGAYSSRTSGDVDVDAELAPMIAQIFKQGNAPATRVRSFAGTIFQAYGCQSTEIDRMRRGVARQAIEMYGDPSMLVPVETNIKKAAADDNYNAAFKWAPTVAQISFVSGGQTFGPKDVDRLVRNALINESWNTRREYGQLPRVPMDYSYWKTFKDDAGTIYLGGVDRQTGTLDVRVIDVSGIKAEQETLATLSMEAQANLIFQREPDLQYYWKLRESDGPIAPDIFAYRVFDDDRVSDFHSSDAAYAKYVAELRAGE